MPHVGALFDVRAGFVMESSSERAKVDTEIQKLKTLGLIYQNQGSILWSHL